MQNENEKELEAVEEDNSEEKVDNEVQSVLDQWLNKMKLSKTI